MQRNSEVGLFTKPSKMATEKELLAFYITNDRSLLA